jgi:gluconolactonase
MLRGYQDMHRSRLLPIRSLALLSVFFWSIGLTAEEHVGEVIRLDPRFDKLIAKDSKIEKLADGYEWSEGPVWLSSDQALVFSDVPKNVVYRWDTKGQPPRAFIKPSGDTGLIKGSSGQGSNGLTLDSVGRLVLMQHGDRRVARLEPNGEFTTLADRFDGKRLNSPNDGAYHANGDLYFTDPPYGLAKGATDPARELDFSGVYRVDKSGHVSLLTKELKFPNGLAFSPDGKTLYVANSDFDRPIIMAYPVKLDGTLGAGKVFADTSELLAAKKPGLPDGLKLDNAGNVFVTGPGGVHVYASDGKLLGRIDPKVATANCAWGDDGTTLYLTADNMLCRIRTLTKGPLEGPKSTK